MRNHRFLLITAIMIALVTLATLYQFGPPGIRAGQDRLLSTMRVSDGSRISIVAHRTGDLIDAYEVSLFRVYSKDNVYVCFLGHQEAFWWRCSLKLDDSASSVQIRAFGSVLARYSVSDGKVTWLDGRPPFCSYRIDGVRVKWPIPKIVIE